VGAEGLVHPPALCSPCFLVALLDIYVASVSAAHNVCAKNYWIAIVSTVVETHDPIKEVEAGLQLLGPVAEKFVDVSDMYEPLASGTEDRVFISSSYDATSHFETTCTDVKSIYKRLTGTELKVEGKVKKTDE
jgi:Rab GDP dissociation inhibitor